MCSPQQISQVSVLFLWSPFTAFPTTADTSQFHTPTKFPTSPAQLITLDLNDEINGCVPAEVLLHPLQVPSEERVLDEEVPALQWLRAASQITLASWAPAALMVVVPGSYLSRVLPLIQLLLIHLH